VLRESGVEAMVQCTRRLYSIMNKVKTWLASEFSSLRRQVGISADEQERNAHTRPWHIYDCVSGRFYDHVPRLKPHDQGKCAFPKERLCMTDVFSIPITPSRSRQAYLTGKAEDRMRRRALISAAMGRDPAWSLGSSAEDDCRS
jgi:hypothetical protein